MTTTNAGRRALGVIAAGGFLAGLGCSDGSDGARSSSADLFAAEASDYGAVAPISAHVLIERPGEGEPPIDDVNWFARPVMHAGTDRIVAFASHDENYLYNLTRGVRVRIPDRSDAVATPDGRFMTVPSSYTPDSNVRFYPMRPLLDALAAGEDADGVEPAFIHEHASMKRVYYQSTGVLSERTVADASVVEYRLMFSGGHDASNFRIVDYRFELDGASGAVRHVDPSGPMALCPEVLNDLNTPFISKDGRYVAAYTSETAGNSYSPGSSLKVFEIIRTHPEAGTTSCRAAVDFHFAAGKADFSFDGGMLTFHISQGGYLTPFINGGLPATTITDVVVAPLRRDERGRIVGHGGLRRVTTSVEAGVGSYFPAFFPDGTLFYVANSVPRESEEEKRFHFRVVDAQAGPWRANVFETEADAQGWRTLAALWQRSRAADDPAMAEPPFPFKEHEAPWLALSLSSGQCRALVADSREAAAASDPTDWAFLGALCDALGS